MNEWGNKAVSQKKVFGSLLFYLKIALKGIYEQEISKGLPMWIFIIIGIN
jgi:hypothetical protein